MYRDEWIVNFEYGDETRKWARVTFADGVVVTYTETYDIAEVFEQFRTQFEVILAVWKAKHDS